MRYTSATFVAKNIVSNTIAIGIDNPFDPMLQNSKLSGVDLALKY